MKAIHGTGIITGILYLLMTIPVTAETRNAACLVIAHRGASGYMPEHTLAAYRLAILLGADYIEPDLVMSRDGQLIARHENGLAGTTNIAEKPAFAKRRRTVQINGTEVSDWFSEDFDADEIRQLRARERLPELRPANSALNDLFGIPTLRQIIAMVREMEAVVGRRIGLYPELKSPAYFRERGFDPEGTLVQALAENGYDQADAPVFIQSFEAESLRRLNELTELPLIYLLWRNPESPDEIDAQVSDAGLRQLATYVDGIGVEKYGLVIPKDTKGKLKLENATGLVERAQHAGLIVHAWTFRAENGYLPVNLRSNGPDTALGNALAEHRLFIEAGVSGLFTEQPEIGRAACDQLTNQ